jgi:hypothetical protein
MLKYFYSLIFIALTVTCFSQSKGKIKKYKIKSVTEIAIDSTNKSHTGSIIKFDSKANTIFEEQFSKKGNLKKKYTKKFNKYNEIEEHIIYNEKNEVSLIIKTKYKLDKPILISTSNSKGEIIEEIDIKYNGFGEKIEEIKFDSKHIVVQKSIFEYDKKGLKTSKNTFDGLGKLVETKMYTYEY